jgi:glycine reductase complex component B subunit gamma
VVQVTTMTPVALMVGSHRVVEGNGIVHPFGSAEAPPAEERRIRRRILERALVALATPVERPVVLA